MPERRASTTALATALFVLSGASGLVYEVVWFRRFSQVWGSSALAMASVVACFLAGLGLGAALGGRWGERTRAPLRAYALCEVGIGALALLVPLEIAWLSRLTAPLQTSLADAPWALTLVRFALTLLVIGPPCALMGATLPVLVGLFERAGRPLGAATAWLYAANTLGAAAGAAAAGFALLPEIGLLWTNQAAAALNLLVALLAWLALRGAQGGGERDPLPRALGAPPARGPFALAAFATGFASLALQILWARQLALVLGSSTYSFTAAVVVFLLGLALGSAAAHGRLAAGRTPEGTIALACALVVVSTLVSLAFLPDLATAVGALRDLRTGMAANAAVCAGAGAFLEAAPTFGMGLFLPSLAAARGGGPRALGALFAWNTLGALLGAAFGAFALLPWLGSFLAFRLALGLYALAPWVLFRPLLAPPRPAVLGSLLVSALALAATWHRSDPLPTNIGMFWYGPDVAEVRERTGRTLFFEEGATGNVLVLDRPLPTRGQGPAAPARMLSLHVNGKIEAGNTLDMPTQLAMAYLPRALRPRARDVYLIGFGSGTTAGAGLLFEGTRLTCAEIEPAIVAAARCFSDYNHRPHEDPDLELVLDDGRSHLQGSPRRFDLILSEPTNPWVAGVSNLFTREFYETARDHLAEGGVLVQWIQTYCVSPTDYARIAGTLLSVFPRALVWSTNPGDTVVLASLGPLSSGAAALDEAQRLFEATPDARLDLERHFGTADLRSILLERLLLDERGLQRLHARLSAPGWITDQNLRLEYDTPLELFGDTDATTRVVRAAILHDFEAALHRDLFFEWRCGAGQVEALRRLKTELFRMRLVPQGAGVVELALAHAAEDPELLVDHLLFTPGVEREEFEGSIGMLIERSPLEAYRLGKILAQRGDHEPARAVLEALAERHPQSATVWTSLSIVYASLGREADSKSANEKARGLDPLNDLTRGIQRVIDDEERSR